MRKTALCSVGAHRSFFRTKAPHTGGGVYLGGSRARVTVPPLPRPKTLNHKRNIDEQVNYPFPSSILFFHSTLVRYHYISSLLRSYKTNLEIVLPSYAMATVSRDKSKQQKLNELRFDTQHSQNIPCKAKNNRPLTTHQTTTSYGLKVCVCVCAARKSSSSSSSIYKL